MSVEALKNKQCYVTIIEYIALVRQLERNQICWQVTGNGKSKVYRSIIFWGAYLHNKVEWNEPSSFHKRPLLFQTVLLLLYTILLLLHFLLKILPYHFQPRPPPPPNMEKKGPYPIFSFISGLLFAAIWLTIHHFKVCNIVLRFPKNNVSS